MQDIIPKNVSCIYVRQPQALGLGHAVLCALPVVGDNPFAVVLADDLIDAKTPVLKQMAGGLRAPRALGHRGAERDARGNASATASCASTKRSKSPHRIGGIVEKPEPGEGAFDAWRRRPLHPDAAHLPSPASTRRPAPAARSS